MISSFDSLYIPAGRFSLHLVQNNEKSFHTSDCIESGFIEAVTRPFETILKHQYGPVKMS